MGSEWMVVDCSLATIESALLATARIMSVVRTKVTHKSNSDMMLPLGSQFSEVMNIIIFSSSGSEVQRVRVMLLGQF